MNDCFEITKREYNADIIEVEEGSLFALFIEQIKNKKNYDKDMVEEALEAIRTAESSIESLNRSL